MFTRAQRMLTLARNGQVAHGSGTTPQFATVEVSSTIDGEPEDVSVDDSGSEYLPSDDSVVENSFSDEPMEDLHLGYIDTQSYFDHSTETRRDSDVTKTAADSSSSIVSCHFTEASEGEESVNHIPDSSVRSLDTGSKLLPSQSKSTTKPSSSQKTATAELETSSDSETSSTGIKISTSKKHKLSGKRVRNKRYSCFICQIIVINLSRHFKTIHKNDTTIARILALPNRSKERRKEFAKLARVGNFYHNCEVLKFKSGELFLLRVPTPYERTKYSYINYGPCPNCLGFMLKKHLATHMKTSCPEPTTYSNRKPISESNAMLNGIFGTNVSSDFTANILNKMKDDQITEACKGDDLILKFGIMQYEKYSTTQSELIRQSMRQLGRLLLQIKIVNPNLTKLSNVLIPQNFDIIVRATKELCVSHTAIACRPHFETPSLALKLGHSLKKCISFERGTALRHGNIKRNEELLALMSLMDLEWSIRISSNALNTLYVRKLNCTELLPITSDLIKLNNFLETEMAKYQHEIQTHNQPSPKTWTTFATLSLSRIIIFNKRRSGETARMKIDHYAMRPLWTEQTTEELRNSLSPFEKVLAEHFTIVEVPGKRGKKVPILLTPAMKSAVDLLIKTRIFAGINKQNPYVFARVNGSMEHMRGHDCLRKCCGNVQLSSPENINGTKLRKYVATVSQIINLTENETDWLAKHLGHDIRVHRNFYRLQENAVELTKISRVLLAVDSGDTSLFAGKKLHEVELSELPAVVEDNEEEESEMTIEKPVETKSSVGHSENIVKASSQKASSQKASSLKRPWSAAESEAVIKFFRVEIRKEIVPGKSRCEACIDASDVLSERKWKDIKYYVKNYISKMKKLREKK